MIMKEIGSAADKKIQVRRFVNNAQKNMQRLAG
jgi:hypothetical protein